MPLLSHGHTPHTSSLQLNPHTRHLVIPEFWDIPCRGYRTAGQMDGGAGWWTTSGKIGLPQLPWVIGVGRQHNTVTP